MTLSEFKAWFEGFTECMDGAPDKDQWKRIKARVKEIDGAPVTKTVFIDRYLPTYLPTYRPYWAERLNVYGVSTCGSALPSMGKSDAFESHGAMLDLGRAEYSSALSSRSISYPPHPQKESRA